MPTYEFFAYSPDVLAYNSATRAFELDAGFTPVDRNLVQVRDNDDLFDGDRTRNERGDDNNQRGTVEDGAGNPIADGNIYIEEVAVVRAADGSEIELHRIEVDGTHVGYVSSQPLTPGADYDLIRTYNVGADVGGVDTRQNFNFFEQNSVPCFGPATMIMTDEGEVPVEWLDTGHKVLTRDHGYQPILWVGRTKLPKSYFERHPEERPVCIPAGALGENRPTRDLRLTGDHRILVRSAAAQLSFSSSEVLGPAKAWVDAGSAQNFMPKEEFTVTHILCAAHEVIMADGAWVESIFTGPEALRRMTFSDRRKLEDILGDTLRHGITARPCLSRRETVMLLSEIGCPSEPGGLDPQFRRA